MKAFSSSIFALFLLLIVSSVSATTLEDVCKKLSQGKGHIDFNFCITSLQVDPLSRDANTQGLAVIAANLAKVKVTHNKDKASELLKGKDVPVKIKEALQTCVEEYGSSAESFNTAIAYIKLRNYYMANDRLGAGLAGPVKCIDAWHKQSETSPMAKEDGDAKEIGNLAVAIAALLPVTI